jgi:hypothetical protein
MYEAWYHLAEEIILWYLLGKRQWIFGGQKDDIFFNELRMINFSVKILHYEFVYLNTWWGVMRWLGWLRHCARSRKAAGSIPDGIIVFLIDLIFRPHYGSGFDSASDRNEYQGYLLGGKEVHLHVPLCRNSGSLNLLESKRPVQAWYWTA